MWKSKDKIILLANNKCMLKTAHWFTIFKQIKIEIYIFKIKSLYYLARQYSHFDDNRPPKICSFCIWKKLHWCEFMNIRKTLYHSLVVRWICAMAFIHHIGCCTQNHIMYVHIYMMIMMMSITSFFILSNIYTTN